MSSKLGQMKSRLEPNEYRLSSILFIPKFEIENFIALLKRVRAGKYNMIESS